eukprot:CAMPEP_0116886688 /NCGR_PEP_ID=MMETSP0463-20121206/20631_1 /TAXON_ID=181622 /ORGANISM="Strombidinopsis sp, Strain SopsisLIS2011" /LENGTH=62 /DNA_ID=CAMNT_0004547545 /DNA_START=492 /DNA_END=680 /DNA_ORIENTATION=+
MTNGSIELGTFMFIKNTTDYEVDVPGRIFDGFERHEALTSNYKLILYKNYGQFATNLDHGGI